MQLGGDVPAGAGEQDTGAFGQDAAETAPTAVDLPSPAALAAGVIQPEGSRARAADRPSLLVAADQRPYHPDRTRAASDAATAPVIRRFFGMSITSLPCNRGPGCDVIGFHRARDISARAARTPRLLQSLGVRHIRASMLKQLRNACCI